MKAKLSKPIFTISLDFEKSWGVFQKTNYKQNIIGTDQAVIELLKLFKKFNIHATWAVVGMLNYEDKKNLINDLPILKPSYANNNFSSYDHLNSIKENDFSKLYSGKNLIDIIKNSSFQEISSHTFSHYYCLEKGQNVNQFKADLIKQLEISNKNNTSIASIIFPRNQYNDEYLKICSDLGFTSYRGIVKTIVHKPISKKNLTLFKRAIRFIDNYINIYGYRTHSFLVKYNDSIWNIPESFFLTTRFVKHKVLRFFFMKRLKKSMLNAAKTNSLFHIWFHPHNFGTNTFECINQLKELLEYYEILKEKYGMQNLNMSEIVDFIENENY